MRALTLQDMTHRHFPSAMAGVTATGGLHINFAWEWVTIENPGDPTLNGKRERRLFVIKTPKGDRSTVSKRPISEADAAKHYPNEWSAFSLYADVPVYGTALADLPGITQSQISYLALFNIRSVEDLIEIGADRAATMGLEGTRVFKLAEAWDKRRRESGELPELAAVLAKMDVAERARAERDAQQRAYIAELEAKIAALQGIQQQPIAAQHAQSVAAAAAAGVVPAAPLAQTAVQQPPGGGEEDFPYDLAQMRDPFSEGNPDGDPLADLTREPDFTLTDGV